MLKKSVGAYPVHISSDKEAVLDYVHPHTRNIQKKLLPIMKDMQKKGWLAFIPWKVHWVIKYKST